MGVDLANMQSLSKYNKGIKYLLCAIDLFSKYAWVFPLKDKREITIVNAFQKIISKGLKPNKIWVDQGGEFQMYSTYNEGKSAVSETFIRTLKNKNFKHMTAVWKNVFFYALDNIVNKCNNTVHRAIKMKLIDVKSDYYAEYNEDLTKKIPYLKLVFVSEYQNTKTFLRNYILKIGQKKFLLLVKLKTQFPGLMLLVTWMAKLLLNVFMKKNWRKLVKKNLEKKK